MKTLTPRTCIVTLLTLLTLGSDLLCAEPLGTAISYSGRLQQSGNPANGSYDLNFALFDAPTNGVQLGLTITNAAVTVSNGQFGVLLDFGPGAFNGEARWLDIGVRTNGATEFVTLSPRQAITALPYALYALTAPKSPNSGSTFDSLTATNLFIPGGGVSWNISADTNGLVFACDAPGPKPAFFGEIFLALKLISGIYSMMVDGDIVGSRNMSVDGDITTKGRVIADGNIVGNTNIICKGIIRATGDPQLGYGKIWAAGNITAGGNIFAGTNISAGKALELGTIPWTLEAGDFSFPQGSLNNALLISGAGVPYLVAASNEYGSFVASVAGDLSSLGMITSHDTIEVLNGDGTSVVELHPDGKIYCDEIQLNKIKIGDHWSIFAAACPPDTGCPDCQCLYFSYDGNKDFYYFPPYPPPIFASAATSGNSKTAAASSAPSVTIIQNLNQKLEKQEAQIQNLAQQVEALEKILRGIQTRNNGGGQ